MGRPRRSVSDSDWYRSHIESARKSAREARNRRVAAGLCAWGGCKDSQIPGQTYCARHREWFRHHFAASRPKKRAAGVCRDCGNQAISGQTFCEKCASKARERTRLRNLAAIYRISATAFEGLVAKQNGRCAICGQDLDLMRSQANQGPHLDHDHATGRVRGLLCGKCNSGHNPSPRR